MFLQLHGDLPPLNYAENPYKGAAPLPIYSAGYPALGGICAVSLPQDLLRDARGFKDSLKALEKTYKDISGGKKKIKVKDSQMAADPGTIAVVVQGGKWVIKNFDKILALGGALRNLYLSLSVSAINNKTMNRYNANAFGVQNLCAMNTRQILASIDSIDAQINNTLTQIESTPRLNVIRRATLTGELASLTQFRLVFQKQLEAMGGGTGVMTGGVGLVAAALAALSFLR